MPAINPVEISAEVAAKYTLVNNALTCVAKADAADRLDVEVGDTRQSDFLPQVKIMRWDNEVNLSARLIHTETELSLAYEKDVIVWVGKAIEARFYERPDGGYEFEVRLLSPPASNVIQFSLASKAMEFCYQRTLANLNPDGSSWEIDADGERLDRPANVNESYAVYHQNRPVNISGGKEYRAGKAFHIYRPEAWDANGTRTWCGIQITGDVLAIAVSRKFLDDAVYPVTVDPTFGYTTTPVTATTAANNRWYSTTGTPADAGDVDYIKAYLKLNSAGTESYFKGMLVLGGSKAIVANGIGAQTAITSTTPSWLQSDYSSKPAVTAVAYWVGAIFNVNTAPSFYFDDAGSNPYAAYDTSNNYTTPTDPTDLATQNRYYGFYASYTSSSAIKTINSLAKASVKTVNGLAIASVKTWNGLA